MKNKLLLLIMIIFTLNLYAQDEEAIDFVLVDIPPITSDCDKNADIKELKVCFVKSVTNQIVSKINVSLLDDQGLEPAKYRIYALFTINKKGKVSNVKISFENEVIAKEVEKAVKSIERMSPAYLEGKPVKVNYTLPIVFNID